MRLKIIRLIVIGFFVLITVNLFYVQLIRGPYFYNLSKNNRIRIVPLEGWRGTIKDRNGVVLVDNKVSYNVMVTPQDIGDRAALFAFLGETLEIDPKEIERRYRSKSFTPFTPVMLAMDITRRDAMVIEENRYRFPSAMIQEGFKRVYPLKENSTHALGYVGKVSQSRAERFKEYGYSPQSIIGYSGIEEFYDGYLKGRSGGAQIEVNSRGRQVRLLSLREPMRGEDITLTLDSDLQAIAMEAMGAKTGVIVVMDSDTGEILVMNSTPAYDPNIFVDAKSQTKVSSLFRSRRSPLLNRAIKGVFPPGSVFKVTMAVAGLDSKKVTQHSRFVCEGFYEVSGTRFGCPHVHERQNLSEALAHSCNIYFYQLARMLGDDTIGKYAGMLGLGRLTHIDLPYEAAGLIPGRYQWLSSGQKKWYLGDTLNLGIGQGDTLTTPLQLVKMISIVSNEGVEVQPHLIKTIGGKPVDTYDVKREVRIDKRVFQKVKKGLRAVVTDYSGTAHVLDIKGLYIEGKTGTAQSSPGKGHHAWFVGYVKSKRRNLTFCVLLEHGGSSYNACLVARQLLLKMKNENRI